MGGFLRGSPDCSGERQRSGQEDWVQNQSPKCSSLFQPAVQDVVRRQRHMKYHNRLPSHRDFSPPLLEHSQIRQGCSWCFPSYDLLLGLQEHKLLAQSLTSSFAGSSKISGLQWQYGEKKINIFNLKWFLFWKTTISLSRPLTVKRQEMNPPPRSCFPSSSLARTWFLSVQLRHSSSLLQVPAGGGCIPWAAAGSVNCLYLAGTSCMPPLPLWGCQHPRALLPSSACTPRDDPTGFCLITFIF